MAKNYRSKTTKAKKTEKSVKEDSHKRVTKKGSKTTPATKLDLAKGEVRLHINRGRTVNLGNFNSSRMDVGMSRDLGSKETIDSTFTAMDEYLTNYLDKFANAQDILDD